jgi:hypothetical protein
MSPKKNNPIADKAQFFSDLSRSNDCDQQALFEKMGPSLEAKFRTELAPTLMASGSRLLGVHVLSSLLTLSVCPQFGIRLIGEGHGLMALFMPFGMFGCFFFCGAFYLGSTVMLAKLILSRPDWRQVRANFTILTLVLSLCSLILFKLISGTLMLGIALMWFTGALLAARLSLLPFQLLQKVKA